VRICARKEFCYTKRRLIASIRGAVIFIEKGKGKWLSEVIVGVSRELKISSSGWGGGGGSK
jgi:hypothetical protein